MMVAEAERSLFMPTELGAGIPGQLATTLQLTFNASAMVNDLTP